MSPFERVVDELAQQVGRLDRLAQVSLFTMGAQALRGRWSEWADNSGSASATAVFDGALDLLNQFALGELAAMPREILDEIEASTPTDSGANLWFTAAQDCWICLDTAVRGARGEFDPADSTWYLLEPLFQDVSERVFGLSDVGSANQEDAETVALDDPSVVAAMSALRGIIGDLASERLSSSLLAILRARMAAISP